MNGIPPIIDRLILREEDIDAQEWEQIVFAEVLIPDVPNTYGDVYTRQTIKEFAYEFARLGYGIDIDHDNEDIQAGGGAYVAESFIVRAGDQDFIEGSWVVAMKVTDPAVWQSILDGEINGYSYQAFVSLMPIFYDILAPRTLSGETEPYPRDGHTHGYTVLLNDQNKVIGGGTTETDGHSHTISGTPITDRATTEDGISHTHRYSVHYQQPDTPLEAIS